MSSANRQLLLLRAALLACGLSAAAAAGADTIYKYLDAQGRTAYSDQPPVGRPVIERFEVPTPTAEELAATQRLRREAAAEAAAVEERMRRLSARREAAYNEEIAAEQELKAAEEALEKGREPLPGERRGIVCRKSGGCAQLPTRLDDAYFERIKQLEEAVEQARERLGRAHRIHRALE